LEPGWHHYHCHTIATNQDTAGKIRSLGATITEIAATPPSTTSTVLSYEFKRDLNIYLKSKIITLPG
jgi:hypothetical protein